MIEGFWVLLPNSQKGMRLSSRDIWHFVERYDPRDKPRGFSCYKRDGEYYSICRAGIPSPEMVDKRTEKPPYKDSCKACVRIFKKHNIGW